MSASNRRLAAIMFTDIVGYSAVTHQNEKLSMELLKVHRELLRPLFPDFGGREIKTTGDGFLIEFSSALKAVECGAKMQETLVQRNSTSSLDEVVEIRIGIHLGDVEEFENDVYGDGVNIAARIEPLAESNGICVSEDVMRQVINKIPYDLVQIGEQDLKNIELKMDLYQVRLPWIDTLEVPQEIKCWVQTMRTPLGIFQLLVLSLPLIVLALGIAAALSTLSESSLRNDINARIESLVGSVPPDSILKSPSLPGFTLVGMPDFPRAAITSAAILSADDETDWIAIGTSDFGIFITNDFGLNWISVGMHDVEINYLAAVDDELFAATENGIHRYDFQAAAWRLSGFAGRNVRKFLVSAESHVYGLIDGNIFMEEADANAIQISSVGGIVDFGLTTDLKIFAATANEIHQFDSGGNFEGSEPFNDGRIQAIALSSDNRLAIGTDSGAWIRTIGNGAWTELVSVPEKLDILSLAFERGEGKEPALLAGTSNGIRRLSGTRIISPTRSSLDASDSVYLIDIPTSNRAIALYDYGVRYSSNFATQWRQLERLERAYDFESLPDGKNYLATSIGVFENVPPSQEWVPVNRNLEALAVKELEYDAESETLYAGTERGLFRAELGQTQRINWVSTGSEFDGARIQAIWLAHHSVLVGTDQGLFSSLNNGRDWTLQDASTSITALDVGEDSTIFAATAEGLKSKRLDGTSWANTTLSEEVLDIEIRGNQIIAASQNTIYRSSDGGITWNQDNAGLPPNAAIQTIYSAAVQLNALTSFHVVVAGLTSGLYWKEWYSQDEWETVRPGFGNHILTGDGIEKNGILFSTRLQGIFYGLYAFPNSAVTSSVFKLLGISFIAILIIALVFYLSLGRKRGLNLFEFLKIFPRPRAMYQLAQAPFSKSEFESLVSEMISAANPFELAWLRSNRAIEGLADGDSNTLKDNGVVDALIEKKLVIPVGGEYYSSVPIYARIVDAE